MSRLIRLCELRFLVAGALLAGVALVSCASDVGTALAKEPGGTGGGMSEGPNARRETEEPQTDAIAQAAKDAARYAADASHEASQAADTAVRTVRSVVSETLVAVRRETRRALAVA